jgi:glucosamine kinase
MILVADSGSTKTQGVLIAPGGKQFPFECPGINPLFHTASYIEDIFCAVDVLQPYTHDVKSIHFYGAGCSTTERNTRVKNGLQAVFPQASIKVDHDLMGAALSNYKGQPYISCILGTGTNTGFFDGKELIRKVPSLGYILGDEGSGADIGKVVLRDYLYGNLPLTLSKTLEDVIGNDTEVIIDRLYRQPNPNRYLAEMIRHIQAHHNEEYVQSLVADRFRIFSGIHLTPYTHLTRDVSFTGGIAFHFSDVLKSVLQKEGWNVVQICERPLEGLMKSVLGNQNT